MVHANVPGSSLPASLADAIAFSSNAANTSPGAVPYFAPGRAIEFDFGGGLGVQSARPEATIQAADLARGVNAPPISEGVNRVLNDPTQSWEVPSVRPAPPPIGSFSDPGEVAAYDAMARAQAQVPDRLEADRARPLPALPSPIDVRVLGGQPGVELAPEGVRTGAPYQTTAPATADDQPNFLRSLYEGTLFGEEGPSSWVPGVGWLKAGEKVFNPETGYLARGFDEVERLFGNRDIRMDESGVVQGRRRTVGDLPLTDRYSLPDQSGFQGGRGGAGSGGVGPVTNTGVTPLPTDSRGVTPMPTIVGGGPSYDDLSLGADGSGMGKTTPSFEELLEVARSGAIEGGQRAARQRGLDPLNYTDLFTGEAQRIGETVPVPTSDAPTDFSAYFTPDFGPSTLAGEEARLRGAYGRDVRAITPSGFERGYFGSSFGDPTIQNILAERRAPAEQFIQRAAARGQLKPRGQEAARDVLGRQESVGRAALGTERDLLTKRYRSDLTGIGHEAAEGAAGFTLGGAFDPQSFSNRISEAAARSGAQFEGELRGAAGPPGTYFDPQAALLAGGIQGPRNLGAGGGGIQNVLEARRTGGRDTRRGYGRRGLGTTGAF
jgi:hypothetical protein